MVMDVGARPFLCSLGRLWEEIPHGIHMGSIAFGAPNDPSPALSLKSFPFSQEKNDRGLKVFMPPPVYSVLVHVFFLIHFFYLCSEGSAHE